MYLISVNIGKQQLISYGGASEGNDFTGIYKLPTREPVSVGRDGLAGDVIVDRKNHGGPDQAVYVYGGDDYAWWSAELGRDVGPGTFGENLTVAGLASAACLVGDRLRAGTVTLEVTAPRIPCRTLAAAMRDPAFVKRFRAAERPGLFCRVILEGQVTAGDPVTYEPYGRESVSILEMFRGWYDRQLDEAAIRRQLAAPIAIRARAEQEARLEKLLAAGPAAPRA